MVPPMSDGATPTEQRFCVIGAGPSGLAMAAAFRQAGVPYDHFERHSDVGGLWDIDNPGSPMYESAHFISSKTQSKLHEYPMPEGFPDYPRHDQVLAYLKAFSEHHGLRQVIQFGQEVEQLLPEPTSARIVLNGVERRYRGVVCASGVNWEPLLPDVKGCFAGEVRHSSNYRSPAEFAGKRVVIVGLGNSAADIACDAARVASQVTVSLRRGYHFLPKYIFGKPTDVFAHEGPSLPLWLEQPLFTWLQRLIVGDTAQLGMPVPDHKLLETHPLLNDQLLHYLRHGDVQLKGALQSFDQHRVLFADGSELEADLVMFATGYTRRIPYLDPKYLEPGEWAASHFLTCFSRRFTSLFTLGFIELNGALYPHVSRLAALIARVAIAELKEPAQAERFYAFARSADFDLSGGRQLLATGRHAHYCDDRALTKATKKTFRRMGWSDRLDG